MTQRFRILREIPEVFEVDAESYDEAVNKITSGEIDESESLQDRYSLVEATHAHSYSFSGYCGVQVCHECRDHKGLVNCYCGWSAGGGDGRRNLIEDGETIEADDY